LLPQCRRLFFWMCFEALLSSQEQHLAHELHQHAQECTEFMAAWPGHRDELRAEIRSGTCSIRRPLCRVAALVLVPAMQKQQKRAAASIIISSSSEHQLQQQEQVSEAAAAVVAAMAAVATVGTAAAAAAGSVIISISGGSVGSSIMYHR
jgi:hypothetical protein